MNTCAHHCSPHVRTTVHTCAHRYLSLAYTHTQPYTHAPIAIYTHTHNHTHMHTAIHTYTHTRLCLYTHTHKRQPTCPALVKSGSLHAAFSLSLLVHSFSPTSCRTRVTFSLLHTNEKKKDSPFKEKKLWLIIAIRSPKKG